MVDGVSSFIRAPQQGSDQLSRSGAWAPSWAGITWSLGDGRVTHLLPGRADTDDQHRHGWQPAEFPGEGVAPSERGDLRTAFIRCEARRYENVPGVMSVSGHYECAG